MLVCLSCMSAYSGNLEQQNQQLRNKLNQDMQIYGEDLQNYSKNLYKAPSAQNANGVQQVPQFKSRVSTQQLKTDTNNYAANTLEIAAQKYAAAMKVGDKQHACAIAASSAMNAKMNGDMANYNKWKQMDKNACTNTPITDPEVRDTLKSIRQIESMNFNIWQQIQNLQDQ